MNAQEQWKSLYCSRKVLLKHHLCGDIKRNRMRQYRREAALERRCNALTRQVETLQIERDNLRMSIVNNVSA